MSEISESIVRAHQKNERLYERVRALEKQVDWLTESRDSWRVKALARQRIIQRHAKRAREQWRRAEMWRNRCLRKV